MVSSINNIDRRRASAEAFVNMNDKNVTKLASRANSIAHHKRDQRVKNTVNFVTKSIPVIAAASAFAVTKNPKTALKQGAIWGALIAVPAMVTKANNKLKKDTTTPENKNGHGLSFGGELLATVAGFIGATAAINALGNNAKVNKVVDTAISKTKDAFNYVAGKVKVPEAVAKKSGEFMDKAKNIIPENVKTFTKETAAKVNGSETFQKVVSKSKGLGKTALKYAPEIALGAVVLGTLGYGVKAGSEIVSTKNKVKQEQFETAKEVIKSYKAENEDLKAKLAEKNAPKEA